MFSILAKSLQGGLSWEISSVGLTWASCWLTELITSSLLESWKVRWSKGDPSRTMRRSIMEDGRLFGKIVDWIPNCKTKALLICIKIPPLEFFSLLVAWGTDMIGKDCPSSLSELPRNYTYQHTNLTFTQCFQCSHTVPPLSAAVRKKNKPAHLISSQ